MLVLAALAGLNLALEPAPESAPKTPVLVAAPEAPAIEPEPIPILQDPAPEEDAGWTGSWALGASRYRGNTDTDGFNTTFDAVNETGKNTWTIGAYANWGQETTAGVTRRITDKTGASGQYDRQLGAKTSLFGLAAWQRD